jgi:hypothetical protein
VLQIQSDTSFEAPAFFLKTERHRTFEHATSCGMLDAVNTTLLKALVALVPTGILFAGPAARPRRKMTEAAKKAISERMKRLWAARRKVDLIRSGGQFV